MRTAFAKFHVVLGMMALSPLPAQADDRKFESLPHASGHGSVTTVAQYIEQIEQPSSQQATDGEGALWIAAAVSRTAASGPADGLQSGVSTTFTDGVWQDYRAAGGNTPSSVDCPTTTRWVAS